MNVNEAIRLTEENQKNNKDFQNFINYTNEEIKKACEQGKRRAVMFTNYNLTESLIKYWESKGFEVKRLFPPQTTLYVIW